MKRSNIKNGWRHCALLSLALSALFLLVAGCGSSNGSAKAAADQGPPVMPVQLQPVRSTEIQDTTEYVATLKSRASSALSPQVDGQITHIYVKSGDKVTAGTPLMQIDPVKQQATVNSQESTRASKLASLRYAQQEEERMRKLFGEGVVSKQNLDQAQQAYAAAQADYKALDAQVREQQVQLHYYKVTSPTDGIVGDIPVRVGDRVTSSSLLTTVDKPGNLEAYVYVPVERSANLHMNQPVQILDSDGKVISTSKITFISPQVNDQTQTVLAKASIQNKSDLRTAQFIRARVIWGSREGPVVPVLAVTRINGQFFVYTAEGNAAPYTARQKLLHLGDMLGNDYVVLDGVKPGERLIVSGTQFLVDGAQVKDAGASPQG